MVRLVAVSNQKGGVAKTTTTHSLGFALAELGRRVLLVDLDPQACLTYSTGIDPLRLDLTLHEVFRRQCDASDIRCKIGGRVDLELLPAAIDLGASEIDLLSRIHREHYLAHALRSIQEEYDYVLIDCPPSLGVLTINGLTAAHEVLIPCQCEALSTRGVAQLLETIDDVRIFANERLRVRGVVATMYGNRARHSRAMLDRVRDLHGLDLVGQPVPKSVRFAEAPSEGRCILEHAPSSAGAEAYRVIARELDADLCVGECTDASDGLVSA